MAQLEIRDVTLNFGGITALSNVSFQVNQGNIHALIGPNGAGKTSTFKVLATLMEPTYGEVTLAQIHLHLLEPLLRRAFFRGQALRKQDRPHGPDHQSDH